MLKFYRYQEIGKSDPTRAKQMFSLGEDLVLAARNGELSRFKRLALNDSENLLLYFVAKAFQTSLLMNHLMISTFIVQNGFPVNGSGLPNFLNECLSCLEDSCCVPVIAFFLQSTKHFDINHQAPGTWLTPLHIAIQRLLPETCKYLIANGADVNAVADGDLMPLNIIQSMKTLDKEDNRKREIISTLLLQNGAKETWRRNIQVHSEDIFRITSSLSSSAAVRDGKATVSTGYLDKTGHHIPNNIEEEKLSGSKTKMVRFTGGSLPMEIGSVQSALSELTVTAPSTAVSEDGGMLFSTG
mmetsp:Transcript_32998/g.47687  ORF Transcript_32998/g.47687 Transcript_32998/m.47687 type:complete len:299 (+) Transcript_32998:138-1034(+)